MAQTQTVSANSTANSASTELEISTEVEILLGELVEEVEKREVQQRLVRSFCSMARANLSSIRRVGIFFYSSRPLQFNSHQMCLPLTKILCLKTVAPFFMSNNAENMRVWMKVRGMPGQKQQISFRSLDYIFTNYSKQHTLILGGVDVFKTYDFDLARFTKDQLDMFARKECCFYIWEGCLIRTTPAQLRFAKFFVESGMCTFVLNHYETFKRARREHLRQKKLRDQSHTGAKRKRTALIKHSFKGMAYVQTKQ